jgi:diguanylate cyclase
VREAGAGKGIPQRDVVCTLGERMKKAGVEGRPENYALFYRAYVDSNEELRLRLEALGPNPPPERLDELFQLYGHDPGYHDLVELTHGRMMETAGVIMDLIHREQNSLEKYGELLDSTASGIASDKPVEQDLLRRIVAILASATSATVKRSQESAHSMAMQSAELHEMRRELEAYKNLAETDPLTELRNRRAFDRSMALIMQDNKLRLQNSLILIDIDRFKDLNDLHGHLIGDKVLRRVTDVLRGKSGPHVSLFRIGGEEFALLVEGLTEESTERFADGLRLAVEKERFEAIAPGLSVTISVGLCKATDADHAEDLFDKADNALYASKSRGRNRITSHPIREGGLQRKNWMLYQDD